MWLYNIRLSPGKEPSTDKRSCAVNVKTGSLLNSYRSVEARNLPEWPLFAWLS